MSLLIYIFQFLLPHHLNFYLGQTISNFHLTNRLKLYCVMLLSNDDLKPEDLPDEPETNKRSSISIDYLQLIYHCLIGSHQYTRIHLKLSFLRNPHYWMTIHHPYHSCCCLYSSLSCSSSSSPSSQSMPFPPRGAVPIRWLPLRSPRSSPLVLMTSPFCMIHFSCCDWLS